MLQQGHMPGACFVSEFLAYHLCCFPPGVFVYIQCHFDLKCGCFVDVYGPGTKMFAEVVCTVSYT